MTKIYIDRDQMLQQLSISRITGCWTPELTQMFQLLCANIAHSRAFIQHRDREDLIQEGLVYLLEIWTRFDIDRVDPNPFGYFTKCIFRRYSKIIKTNVEYTQFLTDARAIADHYADCFLKDSDD
jgi:hypothetical protein